MTVYELPQPYDELEHTADVGVRVRGATAEETLARLVLAFTSLVLGDEEPLPSSAAPLLIEIDPADRVGMAVDVLRELLFHFDAHQLLPKRAEVHRFDETTGTAITIGLGRHDPDTHLEAVELKAITWHDAVFEERNGEWIAEIIFDI